MKQEFSKVDYTELQYNLIKKCSDFCHISSDQKPLKDKISNALIYKKVAFFERIITQDNTIALYENIEFYRPYIKNPAQYLNDEFLDLLFKIITKVFTQISKFIANCKIVEEFFEDNQNNHLVNHAIDYILKSTKFEPYVSPGLYHFENPSNGLEKTILTQLIRLIKAEYYRINPKELIEFRLALEITKSRDSSFEYLSCFISELNQLEKDIIKVKEEQTVEIRYKFDQKKMNDFIICYLNKPNPDDIYYLLERKKISKPLLPKTFIHLAHILFLLVEKKIITNKLLEQLCNTKMILKPSGNPATLTDVQT